MRIGVLISVTVVALLTVAMFTMAGWTRPPVETIQRGFRGLGMVELYNPRTVAVQVEEQRIPAPLPPAPTGGPKAGAVYKNVQVLGDLGVAQFARLMAAITQWVAPEQGCAYCHGEGGNLASDDLYTKVVARRMLQMTRHINSDWQNHVGSTGVTCYTCHRGQPVPGQIWFADAGQPRGMAGNRAGQNMPASLVGNTSLPHDPFSMYLDERQDGIRVVSTTALPDGNRHSIKQAEATYGLMIHMSQALGVNCTFCHNTRSFLSWDQSTPQRSLGWYGIRLVGELNRDYLEPLGAELPHAGWVRSGMHRRRTAPPATGASTSRSSASACSPTTRRSRARLRRPPPLRPRRRRPMTSRRRLRHNSPEGAPKRPRRRSIAVRASGSAELRWPRSRHHATCCSSGPSSTSTSAPPACWFWRPRRFWCSRSSRWSR